MPLLPSRHGLPNWMHACVVSPVSRDHHRGRRSGAGPVMSDGKARRTRPALRLARDEPDQVPRLLAFRAAHPHVIIGAGEFGVWQALIPRPDGETVINRYELKALLDKLESIDVAESGEPPGQAG